MGFKRGGRKTGGHNWLNSPTKLHQVCIKCGLRRDITYSNSTGKTTTVYTTKEGIKSTDFIECK